ncbi:Ubiquitin carboxyl-terminal hydrolase isozyme L3 [Rhizoclosmatium sp. JEL0117]|nr:Ubiquitin carboxyl-terminal hydrolase isozyme L3 [Rhizoclosmatium sp. JEL0117]
MAHQHWLPLESNPDVMNEYLEKLGIPASNKIAFTDVWGLDQDALDFIPRPIKALLLLFPVSACEKGEPIGTQVAPSSDGPLFIKQTIGNACGTIAILHALANGGSSLDLGSGAMNNLFTKLAPLSPDDRAKALETDEDLKRIHEQSSLEGQTHAPSAEEDVDLHFIAFVPVGGKVYELDGRKSGPVLHGTCGDDGEAFLTVSANAIQQFIARDPDGNTFTVVALAGQQD